MERVTLDDHRLAPFTGMYAADERGDDLCIIESRLAVESLIDSPYEAVSLLVAERLVDSLAPLIDAFPGLVLVASQDVINATVGFNMHRGVAACARRGAARTVADVVATSSRLVVTEGVSDPENLGALFRNAAAFGVDGMLLDPTTCDALSRRTIRVSLGHALRVRFARASLTDIVDGLDGVTTIALTPNATTALRDVNADRTALLVGNEGNGLTEAAMAMADVRAAIPMAKGVDSLNVATAAAVALAMLAQVTE
ncbi:MAG: RNA methyltransferase [Actinobacteria bacterium]|nr:RNA methyltransferase [Actinomycetota bacterium]